ncbi:MAG: class I SAM-dependent methyltransferase [Gammaproteobacteria bacterium]|nr:class I SAM-dependent methyltransferase [Gammaproteobacteria bacterium]
MSLKTSYTLLSPFYDHVVKSAFDRHRKKFLLEFKPEKSDTVLITGIGTGLDIPHLPVNPRYIGVDLTFSMLARAKKYTQQRQDVLLHCGDAMQLPYADNIFDHIIMHLILAVVPEPALALKEAARVLRPGGSLYVFDKFLRPGQLAPIRRIVNLFSRHLATRTDVVFETLLQQCPELELVSNKPANIIKLMPGWFRYIKLKKH